MGRPRTPPVDYAFYLDGCGGTLGAEEFAEALPAAMRCVSQITGGAWPSASWDAEELDAWRRAACAAAEAFAEYGEGRVGGFTLGEFSVTNYRDDGTCGRDVAVEAALAELSGTGLAFGGVA